MDDLWCPGLSPLSDPIQVDSLRVYLGRNHSFDRDWCNELKDIDGGPASQYILWQDLPLYLDPLLQ